MCKEYIEREAVIGFLENMAASRYLIQCFESKEKFPAADVVEVRHGYWRDNRNGTFICSVCGDQSSKMNWCGRCGAKMGGKEKGK